MPFSKLILSYGLTFAVFFVIDMAWLGFIAKDLYRKHLSAFLSDQVNWPLTIVFIDVIWGFVLTGLVATAGFYIVKWMQ